MAAEFKVSGGFPVLAPYSEDAGVASMHGALTPVQGDDNARRWLGDTPLLQLDHPRVRVLGYKLGALKPTPEAKALACFQWVRNLPFGCLPDSIGASAPEVIRAGRGDCHSKSTVLVALLRAAGIPARMRFVTLKADFLRGIIDLGSQPVEHAYTELLLGGSWIASDSYVVDLQLAAVAKSLLRAEDRSLGYGMHRDGAMGWNTRDCSFAQFSAADPSSLPLHDWGAFDDPYQFYSSVSYVNGRLRWPGRMMWRLGAEVVNRRVRALRRRPLQPFALPA